MASDELKRVGLGVDAGASSTRWRLVDGGGRVLGEGLAGPVTGHLFAAEERQETLARLKGMLGEVRAVAQPHAVVAGVTGLHTGTEVAETLIKFFAEGLELSPTRVAIDNDVSIAYRSAFRPGEGVLLYAGTGSVAYHIRADSVPARAGGYGYLIDDAGAGFWIGQAGLRRVLRWADETGGAVDRPLANAMYDALGSRDWPNIMETVYGGGRAGLAALAPAVAKAAREGDEAAVGILQDAGRELARLARALLERLEGAEDKNKRDDKERDTPSGRLPVAFAGGITQLSPQLTAALRAALPPQARFEVVTTPPVQTAATLAAELAAEITSAYARKG